MLAGNVIGQGGFVNSPRATDANHDQSTVSDFALDGAAGNAEPGGGLGDGQAGHAFLPPQPSLLPD